MAISKIQLPSNTTLDIHDARIPAPTSSDNDKVLGVTDTSGALGWVEQSGGVTDVTVDDVSIVTNGVAELETESVSSIDLETPVETSYPSGGFRSNKIYDLGTMTGSQTFALYTTGIDSTIKNEWVWSFVAGSAPLTITWPAGITWDGGSAPTVNASCLYEISVRLIGSYYIGYYKEIALS